MPRIPHYYRQQQFRKVDSPAQRSHAKGVAVNTFKDSRDELAETANSKDHTDDHVGGGRGARLGSAKLYCSLV